MLEREVAALQKKVESINLFNSSDYEDKQLKIRLREKKAEPKSISKLVEQDEKDMAEERKKE